MADHPIRLVAHRVRFYSVTDEDNFFSWLRRIALIKNVVGQGDSILIECDSALMSDDALRELIALFFRYDVDTQQLDIFLTDENRSWFMDAKAYWRRGS
jgi:hypothetical protein